MPYNEIVMLYSKTAAAHMTTHIPTAHPDATVGEAKRKIFKNIHKFKTLNYVYLIDDDGVLKGAVSFKHLLQKYDKTKLRRLAAKRVTYGHERSSIQHVAHLAVMHNIKAVPIVDEERKLLGVVSNDTILSELYRENRRRLYKSAGILAPASYVEDTLGENVVESFLHRIPWVIIGLIGGILIARVVGAFDGILQENLILASFIPLIVYISAAVGAQTEMLYIRDLALRKKLPLFKYSVKQFLVNLFIAACSAALITTIVFMFWNAAYLGMVIGVAAFIAITSSTFIALSVPTVLLLFKQDPANGSGPFATILQDFLSVLIYFCVATLLL